jgi:hypothetical protein
MTAPSPVAEFLNSTLDLYSGEWLDTVDRVDVGPGNVTSVLALVRCGDCAPDPAPHQRPANPPARQSLRSHISDVDAIADTIESLDDEELDEATRDELSAMLIEAIAGTRAKVDSTAKVLAMFEAMEAAPDAEIARLQKRKAFYARQRERLEKYVIATMDASGLTHLDGEISTLRKRLNPPAAVPDAAVLGPLAPEFVRPPKPAPWEPVKSAIKAAIAAGRQVPGWACVQTPRLVRS